MKFGIFYEMQICRAPGRRTASCKLFHDALDQVELADGSATTTPGRWSTTSSRSTRIRSAPGVFLGAASQRTKHIRLAHGILQLTTNHPSKVAAQVAIRSIS